MDSHRDESRQGLSSLVRAINERDIPSQRRMQLESSRIDDIPTAGSSEMRARDTGSTGMTIELIVFRARLPVVMLTGIVSDSLQ